MTAAEHTDRVGQAAEMVAAQAKCSLPQALLLMEARANETGRTLEEIANEVVEQEIRFNG